MMIVGTNLQDASQGNPPPGIHSNRWAPLILYPLYPGQPMWKSQHVTSEIRLKCSMYLGVCVSLKSLALNSQLPRCQQLYGEAHVIRYWPPLKSYVMTLEAESFSPEAFRRLKAGWHLDLNLRRDAEPESPS